MIIKKKTKYQTKIQKNNYLPWVGGFGHKGMAKSQYN